MFSMSASNVLKPSSVVKDHAEDVLTVTGALRPQNQLRLPNGASWPQANSNVTLQQHFGRTMSGN
jgi:hypothetical protein